MCMRADTTLGRHGEGLARATDNYYLLTTKTPFEICQYRLGGRTETKLSARSLVQESRVC